MAASSLALLTSALVPGLAGGCVLVTGGQPHPLSVEMVCPEPGMSIPDLVMDMTRDLVGISVDYCHAFIVYVICGQNP